MPRAQISCLGVPDSVQAARAFVVSTLTGWDAGVYEWPAVLVVSELATNAVLHAGTAYEVHLILALDSLGIEVRDGNPLVPARRRYGTDTTTGRGMRLVSELSTGWQVDRLPHGKIVRCALPRVQRRHDDDSKTRHPNSHDPGSGDPGSGDPGDGDPGEDVEALFARFPDGEVGGGDEALTRDASEEVVV